MTNPAAPSPALRVIKLGGSLFDYPDLRARFHAWLAHQSPAANLVVAGGGDLVEAIRRLDQRRSLGEIRAHRLCIRAMGITAELAAQLLGCELVTWPVGSRLPASEPDVFVVDVTNFIAEDQQRSDDPLPESWQVTSDSIAARMAAVLRADELVLLKSALPEGETLEQMSVAGYVDLHFPRVAVTRPLRFVDLRTAAAGAIPTSLQLDGSAPNERFIDPSSNRS